MTKKKPGKAVATVSDKERIKYLEANCKALADRLLEVGNSIAAFEQLRREFNVVQRTVQSTLQSTITAAAKELMYDEHSRDRIAQMAVRECVHLARVQLDPLIRAEAAKGVDNQVRDILRAIDMGPLLEKAISDMIYKILSRLDFNGKSMERSVNDRIIDAVSERIHRRF